jgi:hypothetical protein
VRNERPKERSGSGFGLMLSAKLMFFHLCSFFLQEETIKEYYGTNSDSKTNQLTEKKADVAQLVEQLIHNRKTSFPLIFSQSP